MKTPKEYVFYDGECTTTVDRGKETVTMYELGGWSRTYQLTFKDLVKYAKLWDIKLKLTDSDEKIASDATNIILANNAAKHGLNPFRYILKSTKITHPEDLEIIKNFEGLLKKYEVSQVLSVMNKKKLKVLQDEMNKDFDL